MDDVVVAGIDVGGPKKGYHAVALAGQKVSKFTSRSATDVANWCAANGAVAVGIDSPCGWSITGSSRLCERELRIGDAKINCFATPSQERALAHVKGFYDWVHEGHALFAALADSHPLYPGGPPTLPCSFETFPHAVVCALNGRLVRVKPKATSRRQAVREEILDDTLLTNIDYLDAALCAITARFLTQGEFQTFGEAAEGFIVVPRQQSIDARQLVRYNGPMPSYPEYAFQIWPLLAYAARKRKVLTYGGIADSIGLQAQHIGRCLAPIEAYCIAQNLPPLTILVVSADSRKPGAGFIGADLAEENRFDQELETVFNTRWGKLCPDIATLAKATKG